MEEINKYEALSIQSKNEIKFKNEFDKVINFKNAKEKTLNDLSTILKEIKEINVMQEPLPEG